MLERARELYELPLEVVDVTANRHEFIVVLRKPSGVRA